jgi:hypothetical protein
LNTGRGSAGYSWYDGYGVGTSGGAVGVSGSSGTTGFRGSASEIWSFDKRYHNIPKKEYKRVISEMDPYGEEDWDN